MSSVFFAINYREAASHFQAKTTTARGRDAVQSRAVVPAQNKESETKVRNGSQGQSDEIRLVHDRWHSH